MKMSPLIVGLVCFILGGAGGFGAEWYVVSHAPPKSVTNNYTTTQNVETKSTSIQDVNQSQASYMIVSDKTNFKHVSIDGNGKTNYSIYVSSRTNTSHKTNK